MYGDWSEQDEYESSNEHSKLSGAVHRASQASSLLDAANTTIARLQVELKNAASVQSDWVDSMHLIRELLGRQHKLSRDDLVTELAGIVTSAPSMKLAAAEPGKSRQGQLPPKK